MCFEKHDNNPSLEYKILSIDTLSIFESQLETGLRWILYFFFIYIFFYSAKILAVGGND